MTKISKFAHLVHYVCAKCDDPKKLGATKLNKILWYADTIAYRETGKTISGEKSYIKRQHGPVPKKILLVLEQLKENEKILQRNVGRLKEFIPLQPADPSQFTRKEQEIIDSVIEIVCNDHTASSISELSHDMIWEAAKEGEEIPVYAVLAANPGIITKDDQKWADDIISSRTATA